MLITGQTITDSAIDLADMKNSQFIDQTGLAGTELVRYLNIAYRDLYNQIMNAHEMYFATTNTFTLVGSQDTYPLPADFYKLNGVDLALDSSGRFLTLRPFMFSERNKYRSGLATPLVPYANVCRYIIAGTNIRFLPIPSSNTASITLWYTPEPTVIPDLITPLQVIVGGDEYITLYVAQLMLSKEESDTTAIQTKRMEVLNQLLETLKSRDEGAPSYIVDESSINDGALFPFLRGG